MKSHGILPMLLTFVLLTVLLTDVWAQNTGSALFNGNARIRVTDNYPINPNASPSAYVITGNTITVEAWVFPMRLPAHNEGATIVLRPYWRVEPYKAYELIITNYDETDNPRYQFSVTDGNVPLNGAFPADSNPPVVGSWTHVAGTYDGSMARLYVNGELVDEKPFTANIGEGTAGFYIGGLAQKYFSGLIDEVRLWEMARTQQEIQDNMNVTLNGNEPGLVGYWPLDEATEVNGVFPVTVDLTDNHNDLRVHGASFVDAIPGSEVNIAPEFDIQFLAGAVDEEVTFQPSVIGWPLPDLSFVSGPAGMTFDTPTGTISWIPATDQQGYHDFVLEATNAVGTVQETYTIWVDAFPQEIQEHRTNSTVFSVLNNGALGARAGADSAEGDVGFVFNGLNGLYEGDVVIARAENRVSGGLFIREFGIQSPINSMSSHLDGFDQAFETSYNDQRAPEPIGVHIIQRSHSKSTGPGDDYVIMEYEVFNTSGSALNGIYIGLAMDWDVGQFNNNLGGYDAGRKLSYVYEADGAGNPNYYGVAVLTGQVSGHTLWTKESDNADSVLYNRMTTFGESPTTPSDYRAIISVGPYDIPAGGSVRAVFAILGGANLADLQVNRDEAHSVWQLQVVSITPEDGSTSVPLQTPLAIEFSQPVIDWKVEIFPLPESRTEFVLQADGRTIQANAVLAQNTTYQLFMSWAQTQPGEEAVVEVVAVFTTADALPAGAMSGAVTSTFPLMKTETFVVLLDQDPTTFTDPDSDEFFFAIQRVAFVNPQDGTYTIDRVEGNFYPFGLQFVEEDRSFSGFYDADSDGIPDLVSIGPGQNLTGIDIPISVLGILVRAEHKAALRGRTVTLPIRVEGLSTNLAEPVFAYEGELSFDPTFIQNLSISIEGTVSDGAAISTNPGLGSIAFAVARAEAFNKDGVLFYLSFTVAPEAPLNSTTGISFTEFMLNEGSPFAITQDGSLTVLPGLFGDVTQNGEVSAFDASQILQNVVETREFDEVQQILADVSGNGQVTAFDGALVLQFVVGLIAQFPATQPVSKTVVARGEFDLDPMYRVKPACPFELPVATTDLSGVISAQWSLRFDPTLLRFQGVTQSDQTKEYRLVYQTPQEGLVHVALAGTRLLEGEATIARLQFEVVGAEGHQATLRFEGIQLNERALGDLSVSVVVTRSLPDRFALAQNYPNPFNPETEIRYSLPEAVQVRLVIYNLLGQEVRVRVDAFQPAGFHRVVWDGRDSHGRLVSSGLYLYRLTAGDFVQTRRMILLR